MSRLGLCCLFVKHPVRFRQTTAVNLLKKERGEQLTLLSEICLHNSNSVLQSLEYCTAHGIGAFRVMTPLFPRYTHPKVGYRLEELPQVNELTESFEKIRKYRSTHDIRLSLHPDQFNVLASPRKDVVTKTLAELEYQGELAELLNAEVINLHVGGAYGDKAAALQRLVENFYLLSKRVRSRLTLENDDISYSPVDLLPVCRELSIPLVYDVHHHRCLPDGMTIEEATEACVTQWQKRGREPWFHLSSPKNGWQMGNPKPHADYIGPADFPECWRDMSATVDVEAKAKELAVLKLQKWLENGSRKK